MRKLINVILLITFALLVLSYPVWAVYSKSSQSHANSISVSMGQTPKLSLVYKAGINSFIIPKLDNQILPTPPLSLSHPRKAGAGSSISGAVLLVNKNYGLAPDYTPSDLRVPKVPFSFTGALPTKKMAAEAAIALEKLFARARRERIELVAVSGYRPYNYQKAIYQWNIRTVGKKEADRTSAAPGHSEHQTGLAMDLSTRYLHYRLDEKFGDTKEGQWLARHAAEFGFIIRYPPGKEKITGYQYEPWHIRYVGEEHARKIAEAGLTLEEYLQNWK